MKKWILRSMLVLLAVFLLIGLIPFSKEIHYSGIGYEFSLASDGAVAEHEILIDGTYSTILFLKDHFEGTFYVSDVEGLLEGTKVHFTFEPTACYRPVFPDAQGQPKSSEIAQIVFERNFQQLAIMFTTHYEKTEDGIRSGYSDAESNFLVLGAANKAEAQKVYSRMLEEKQ